MNNNNPIQTVSIDKAKLIEEIQRAEQIIKELRRTNAASAEWLRGYVSGQLKMVWAILPSLPEDEQWMHPGCEKPISIADALENLRDELKRSP